MSQRKEKYHRREPLLALRLEAVEAGQEALSRQLNGYIADQEALSKFDVCHAGVQRQMDAEERLRASRERERREERAERRTLVRVTVFALFWVAVVVCLTILLLTVSVDGREADRPGKGQLIAAEPVAMPEAAISAAPLNTLENARITHYCACFRCCGKWADGITASGAPAQEGVTVAVDPALIPLGSRVWVGGRWYSAQDTGVTGAAVDVFVGDHQRALELGVGTETVYWTEANS